MDLLTSDMPLIMFKQKQYSCGAIKIGNHNLQPTITLQIHSKQRRCLKIFKIAWRTDFLVTLWELLRHQ
jgi:hypothetical protein